MPRFLLSLLVSLLAVLAAPAPASAHAKLVSADPVDGSTLQDSPSTIVLTFNETVRPLRSSYSLRSSLGDVEASPRAIGSTLELTPDEKLSDGSWVLVWEVESADGHPVSGVLRFSVGSPSSTPPPPTSSAPQVQDRVLEFSTWVSVAAAFAGILLLRRRLLYAAAASASFFAALRLVDFWERSGPASLNLGEFRAAALMGLAAPLGALFFSLRPRLAWVSALVIAACFAAQGFFAGHHRLFEPTWLMLLVHPLHLAAALLWSGALLAIWLNPSDRIMVMRSSKVSTLAVALLVPSVSVLAFLMLLPADSWGRWEWTISLKTAATVGALFLGFLNHRSLRSAEHSDRQQTQVRLRVLVELVLLLIVAVASASIATATPNSRPDQVPAPTPSTTLPANSPSTLLLQFDDGSVGRLELDSLAPSQRVSMMLFVDSSEGSPLLPESASWEMSMPAEELSGLAGEFMPMGDHLHGFLEIPLPGSYQLKVSVVIDPFTTVSAIATLDVPSSPEPKLGEDPSTSLNN